MFNALQSDSDRPRPELGRRFPAVAARIYASQAALIKEYDMEDDNGGWGPWDD
jgi:hypothetical protein